MSPGLSEPPAIGGGGGGGRLPPMAPCGARCRVLRPTHRSRKPLFDGLHTAARLLKTWSNARAAPTAARCVCTGVGHGTHLGTNNNRRLHGARRARGTSLCPGHILLFGHVNILFSSLLSKSLIIKGREARPGRERGRAGMPSERVARWRGQSVLTKLKRTGNSGNCVGVSPGRRTCPGYRVCQRDPPPSPVFIIYWYYTYF